MNKLYVILLSGCFIFQDALYAPYPIELAQLPMQKKIKQLTAGPRNYLQELTPEQIVMVYKICIISVFLGSVFYQMPHKQTSGIL